MSPTTKTPPKFIRVKPSSRNALYPYLGKWTVLVSKDEKNSLQKNKMRVPKELILYKRVGLGDDGLVAYEITGKYGDGYRMTELYLRQKTAIPSIVESNNIGYQFEKPTIVVKSKDKKDSTSETNWDDLKTNKPNQQYSLGSEEFGPMNTELNSIMKDYLQAIKVDYKTIDAIYQNKKLVNKAVSAVDLINKTVLAIEGKMSKRDLPEEAAHWYIELLGQDSNLFKVMMKDIINYPEYKEVLSSNDYKELYNNDDTLLRKEAVAKLIANNILMEFDKSQKNQVYRWLNALWSFLRNTFGWRNPFARSAYNIFNSKLEDLKKTSKQVSQQVISETSLIDTLISEAPDVDVNYTQSSTKTKRNLGGVTVDTYTVTASHDFTRVNKKGETINVKQGDVLGDIEIKFLGELDVAQVEFSLIKSKYREIGLGTQAYKKTIAEILKRGYQLQSDDAVNVSKQARDVWKRLIEQGYAVERKLTKENMAKYTIIIQNKLLYSIDNKEELKKETNDISDENILKDFDNLFPDYSYLTAEEKSIFLSAVNKGQINIVCGL